MKEYGFKKGIPGILLLSHGPLCTAVLESATMILGALENVEALPFTEDVTLDEYGSKALEIYEAMPEGSVIFFDVFGGTPFNQVMLRTRGRTIDGLCGYGLTALLEAVSSRDTLRGEQLIEAVRETTIDGIVDVRKFMEETETR